jgi:hypothetical protein
MPTPDQPIFKDGYAYVDVGTYRRIAKVARHYTRARDFLTAAGKVPSRFTDKTAFRRHQRSTARAIRQARDYLSSSQPPNGFASDTHTEFMRLVDPCFPVSGKGELASLRLPKALTRHPRFDRNLVDPDQLGVRYRHGSSRQWVADRRDPYLTPFALARALAVERTTGPQPQLVSAGDDPMVFTGPSSRYSHPERLIYQLRRWFSNSQLDRRTLELAINRTVEQYAHLPLEPMRYGAVIRSKQFLRNRRHDLGCSGPTFDDKLALATNPAFRAFQMKFAATNTPATFKLFWKTEPLAESKAKHVPRLIFGSSLENELTERMAFQQFSQAMSKSRWHTPAKLGITNREFGRLFRYHRFDQGWLACATDYTAQDVKMPRAIIDARCRVLARVASRQGRSPATINAAVRAARHVEQFNARAPNGEVFRLRSGVPSGLYLGAEGNTINHTIIGHYLDIAAGAPQLGRASVVDSRYGDDWLRSLAPTRQAVHYLACRERFAALTAAHLGMQFVVDAWGSRPLDTGEPVFLKRAFATHLVDGRPTVVPSFDPSRVLRRWVVPHSVVRTPQDSFDRSLGFLMLCGTSPDAYGTIRQYMDGLVRTHSVVAPRIYRTMTRQSLLRDYYTESGQPSSSARHYAPPAFLEPEQLHMTLTGPDAASIHRLESMSHRDILLSGDVETNPGPINLMFVQRFVEFQKLCVEPTPDPDLLRLFRALAASPISRVRRIAGAGHPFARHYLTTIRNAVARSGWAKFRRSRLRLSAARSLRERFVRATVTAPPPPPTTQDHQTAFTSVWTPAAIIANRRRMEHVAASREDWVDNCQPWPPDHPDWQVDHTVETVCDCQWIGLPSGTVQSTAPAPPGPKPTVIIFLPSGPLIREAWCGQPTFHGCTTNYAHCMAHCPTPSEAIFAPSPADQRYDPARPHDNVPRDIPPSARAFIGHNGRVSLRC